MSNSTPTDASVLLNSDGTFKLNQDTFMQLTKYCNVARKLPTTEADYQTSVGWTDQQLALFESKVGLGPVLQAYGGCCDHAVLFQDTIYPSIVDLANNIYSFAQDAGGTADTSFYEVLCDAVEQLIADNNAKPQDPTAIQNDKTNVSGLIQAMLSEIQPLIDGASDLVTALKNLSTQFQSDQTALLAVDKTFNDDNGYFQQQIKSISQQITQDMYTIVSDQAEYEKDVIIASTTAAYIWIIFPPVGLIAGTVVAGVYGKRATDLQSAIQNLESQVSTLSSELSADLAVMAQLGSAKTSLENLINLIGPAIQVVQSLYGIWVSMQSDLQNISTFTDNLDEGANILSDLIANLRKNQAIDKWNAIGTSIDSYRKSAFVTAPDEQTLSTVAALPVTGSVS